MDVVISHRLSTGYGKYRDDSNSMEPDREGTPQAPHMVENPHKWGRIMQCTIVRC